LLGFLLLGLRLEFGGGLAVLEVLNDLIEGVLESGGILGILKVVHLRPARNKRTRTG
jgi:hypothetical protein